MKSSLAPFVHSFPAPVVVIGCGTVGKPNLITCSWFGTVCSQPPMVGVAVRHTRYSYRFIHETWEFTVNLPRVSDLKAVIYCGSVSGQDTRKFDDLGLTPVPCPPLESAPMIAEFDLSLACRVRHELELGTHHVFLAEVVGVHGTERPKDPSHRPEMYPTEQLVYLDGKYWTLRPVEAR